MILERGQDKGDMARSQNAAPFSKFLQVCVGCLGHFLPVSFSFEWATFRLSLFNILTGKRSESEEVKTPHREASSHAPQR